MRIRQILKKAGWRGFVLAGALAASTALAAGCGASTTQQASTVTVTVERATGAHVAPKPLSIPRKPPSIAQPASLKTFDGRYFSIDYSGSWYIDTAEGDKGNYLDTTIRSSRNPNVMVRVDVSPGGTRSGDLALSARQLEHALREQPGYRRLDFRHSDFNGYPAFRWEFEVEEGGVLLRKVDIFFDDNAGNGYGVLTQAPAATYGLWRQFFQSSRSSLKANETVTTVGGSANASPSKQPPPPPESVAPTPAPPAQGFCDTHACIENFDNGTGSIVQCADGMWSHSGGRPGACSYHGGVAGGSSDGSSTYTPDYNNGDGYTEDYGSGNGYTVTCADGTLSDSGGIQGACSHHGGVG
jgi:hypothetical protein